MAGREPWTDERLAAAFEARSSRVRTPMGLVDATLTALAAPPQSVSRPSWSVAAAVTVVLVVGALAGSFDVLRDRASPSPAGSAPSIVVPATPSRSSVPGHVPPPTAGSAPGTAPSDPGLPTEVFGLEVMDVPAALLVRERPDDDREIAVAGWYWPVPVGVIDCVWDTLERALLDPGCPRSLARLMAEPDEEQVQINNRPRSPSFKVVFGPLERAWIASGVYSDETGPMPVVFVGHFDDRRATACGKDRRSACTDAFLVDAIHHAGTLRAQAWIALGDDGTAPAGPMRARDDIEAIANSLARGEDRVLSIGLIEGEALARLEPRSRTVESTEPWVWYVTTLGWRPGWPVRTFVLPDRPAVGSGVTSYEIRRHDVLTTGEIID
jgi:hypothetical protein